MDGELLRTYGPPRLQVGLQLTTDRSAQTYPACRRSRRRQDGDPRVPVLIKDPASVCRFLNQASGTPVDRQAILQSFPQTSFWPTDAREGDRGRTDGLLRP